jgi:hypothetical protein
MLPGRAARSFTQVIRESLKNLNFLLPRLVQEIDHFFHFGLLQRFASFFQGFLELDGGFLHPLVSFLRTTDEKELIGPGNAAVAVFAIKPKAEHAENFPFFLFRAI